jgi:hypothetical protein
MGYAMHFSLIVKAMNVKCTTTNYNYNKPTTRQNQHTQKKEQLCYNMSLMMIVMMMMMT